MKALKKTFLKAFRSPESFAVINLRGVSTNKTIICFIAMQTYKELSTTSTLMRLLVKYDEPGIANSINYVLFKTRAGVR